MTVWNTVAAVLATATVVCLVLNLLALRDMRRDRAAAFERHLEELRTPNNRTHTGRHRSEP